MLYLHTSKHVWYLMEVNDAKDGYHAVPLAEEDHHLTTLITEEGRLQYCVPRRDT